MSSVFKKIGNFISKAANATFRIVEKAAPFIIAAAVIYYTAGAGAGVVADTSLAGGIDASVAASTAGSLESVAAAETAASTATNSMASGTLFSSAADGIESAWGAVDAFATKHPFITQAAFQTLKNVSTPTPPPASRRIHPDWGSAAKVDAAQAASQYTNTTVDSPLTAQVSEPIIQPKQQPRRVTNLAPTDGVDMTQKPDSSKPIPVGSQLVSGVKIKPLLEV